MDHDWTTLQKWSLFVAGEVQAAQIQPTEERSCGGAESFLDRLLCPEGRILSTVPP